MAVFNSFKRSLSELRSIRCLTTVGVFIAIFVVLDGFCSIRIGDALKINFAYLALAVIGMLFGPTVGLISGFACDLVGYFINPVGAFIPWFALVTALEGTIYGLFLYDFVPYKLDGSKSVKQYFSQYGKILIARTVVVIICNLLLNTYVLYRCGFIGNTEEGFWTLVGARIVTNAIGLAIAFVITPAVLIPVRIAYSRFVAPYRARQH